MKILTLKKVGENSGFCAEHFTDESNSRYVKVTHPVNKDDVTWYTAQAHSWEPLAPIEDKNIIFVETYPL